MNIELRAEKRIYNKTIEFFLIDRDSMAIGTEVIMEKREEGCYVPNPTFSLGESNTQLLMDELWNCGFRPSEGSGSAGAFAAQGSHLKDMQRLVFEKEK